MLARRNFLTLFGAGIATRYDRTFAEHGLQARYPDPASGHVPDPCRDTFADPPWKRLSSANGDLPVPETSDQQTGTVVGDIDGDGRLDFGITNRHHGNAAIWMRNTARVGRSTSSIPARSTSKPEEPFRCRRRRHLDLVAGGDSSTNEVWWWQNPHPDYDRPWKRHIIKDSGKTQHHDLMIGDVLGERSSPSGFLESGGGGVVSRAYSRQSRAHHDRGTHAGYLPGRCAHGRHGNGRHRR